MWQTIDGTYNLTSRIRVRVQEYSVLLGTWHAQNSLHRERLKAGALHLAGAGMIKDQYSVYPA